MIAKWLLAGTLVLVACTSTPRQIVLSIDTTAGVPCDIDRIRVVAKSPAAARTATFERSLKGARLPVMVTLLDDTPAGSFDLEISGLSGDVEVLRAEGQMQFGDRNETEAVLLDTKCTVATPCSMSVAMDPNATASPKLVCRYTANAGLAAYDDACAVPGSVKMATLDNDIPVRLDLDGILPGQFQFYDQAIGQIWVSRDGYVSFSNDNPDPDGGLMPGPLDRGIRGTGIGPPKQSVMAFWETLFSVKQICYVFDGDPGSRRFLLTWQHACATQPCMDDLNFSVALEEGSHDVAIAYGDMISSNADIARGINATVGLVHDANGCPSDQCTSATGFCKDGVTPCGYSQVFSNAVQMPKIPNVLFAPSVMP